MNERGEACCGSEVGRGGGRRSRLSGGGGISFTEDEGEGGRLFLRAAEEGRTPTEDIGEVEERKSDLESVKGALELVEGESEEELFTNHQQRSKYSPRFHDASVSCSPDPSTILSIVSFSHSIAFSAHPSTGIKLSWERVVVVVVDRAGNQSFRLSPSFSIYRRRSPVPLRPPPETSPPHFPSASEGNASFTQRRRYTLKRRGREGMAKFPSSSFKISLPLPQARSGGGLANRREEERRSASLHLHLTLLTTARRRRRRRESQAADGIEPPSSPPPLPKSALRRLFPRKKKEGEKREREGIRVRKRVGGEEEEEEEERMGIVVGETNVSDGVVTVPCLFSRLPRGIRASKLERPASPPLFRPSTKKRGLLSPSSSSFFHSCLASFPSVWRNAPPPPEGGKGRGSGREGGGGGESGSSRLENIRGIPSVFPPSLLALRFPPSSSLLLTVIAERKRERERGLLLLLRPTSLSLPPISFFPSPPIN